MEQTYRRTAHLAPFKLDIPALDAICQKLAAQFPNRLALELQIDLPNRSITVEDEFPDLSEVEDLPPRAHAFRLDLRHDGEGRHIKLEASPEGRARLTVSGPTEAWCAGTLELAATSFARYRQWWWWLRTDAAGLAALIGFIFLFSVFNEEPAYSTGAWSTGLLLAVLLLVTLSREQLMPFAELQLRRVQTLFQKYRLDVTLLIAALSLIASVIQVIQGFMK